MFASLLMLLLVVMTAPATNAQVSTPSAQKIEDLKERLSSKVAQLSSNQPKAIYGTVASVSLTNFVVESIAKKSTIEITDDLVVIQYLKGKRTTLAPEDVEKNDIVTVLGGYDETLDMLKATVVHIESAPLERVSGSITARNDDEFTITVTAPTGQEYAVDIEKITKTRAWKRDTNELVKSGFSKIEIGSTVHILGSPVPKQEQRLSAVRILDLGNLAATSSSAPKPTVSPTP